MTHQNTAFVQELNTRFQQESDMILLVEKMNTDIRNRLQAIFRASNELAALPNVSNVKRSFLALANPKLIEIEANISKSLETFQTLKTSLVLLSQSYLMLEPAIRELALSNTFKTERKVVEVLADLESMSRLVEQIRSCLSGE